MIASLRRLLPFALPFALQAALPSALQAAAVRPSARTVRYAVAACSVLGIAVAAAFASGPGAAAAAFIGFLAAGWPGPEDGGPVVSAERFKATTPAIVKPAGMSARLRRHCGR